MEKLMKIWDRVSTVIIISCFSFIIVGILLVVLIMGGGSLYGAQLNIFELLTLIGMYGSAFLFIFIFFLLKNFILIPLFYYAWRKEPKVIDQLPADINISI